MQLFIIFIATVLAGCGLFPQRVSLDDLRVQTLLQAAAPFDRARYGFTSIKEIPAQAVVRLMGPTKEYDARLDIDIDFRTFHILTFRKILNDNYMLTSEQEEFFGPKQFSTVDGNVRESICLDYQIEKVQSALPRNRLIVSYWSQDPKLMARGPNPSLANIKPILKEWGYVD